MSGRIRIEVDGPRSTLWIDRPEAANALTPSLAHDLAAAIANPPDGARVLILRGAGGRAFCGGFDLGRVDATTATGLEGLMAAVDRSPLPTLAVVDGAAVGAGLELASRCDLRLALDQAKIGLPAVRLGVAYRGDGLAAMLTALGSVELLLTGALVPAAQVPGFARTFPDPEALAAGLDAVVADLGRASPAALSYTVRVTRALRRPALDPPLVEDFDQQRREVLQGPDLAEALAARREARRPSFEDTGRGGS